MNDHLLKLLKQPRTMRILLDLYAPLAESCERSVQSDPVAEAQIARAKSMYRRRVGIDVGQRTEVSHRVNELLKLEASQVTV